MSIKPPTTAQPEIQKPGKPSGSKTALKLFGLVMLIAVFAYVGYFLYKVGERGRRQMGDLFNHPTVAQQFPGHSSINLMIIGRDYDYSNQDVVIKSNARADLLMMAKLDFANNEVKILSIPRDTKATIPGHTPSKINSAEEKGGPALTAATVLQNFNIPEDHYVALDFDGFQEAINVLGGVDLTVDKKMDYDDNWGNLHIHLKPGYQHLDGKDAMGFVRFRHSDSDLLRTKRQQALLAALKLKIDQPGILIALPNLINIMNSSADSDLTDSQKEAIAFWLKDVPKTNFQMDTVPSIEGGYYVYTNWSKTAPLIKSWFGVDPPAGASTVVPVGVAAPHHHRRHVAQPS